jgi:hypothetical protein
VNAPQDGGPGVLPLGVVRSGMARVPVGFAVDDLTGPVYVSGKARSGKTWLLEAMAIHLAARRAGLCFLDPHRDAAMELLQYLWCREDDVVVVDLSRRDRQVGLNPLQCRQVEDVPDVVSRTVGAFQAAYGWTDRTHPRVLTMTRMATQALVEANCRLEPKRQATLFQVNALLTNEPFRAAVLTRCSPAVRTYFESEFPHYEAGAKTPLLDKVSALRADARTRLLLGQSRSTVDARLAMDSGQAHVVSLAGLGDKSQLVGSLVVFELFRAAKARADAAAASRRPFFLICDEAQLYQGPVLAAACGEAPKYGLKLILANQFVGHLTREVRGAILANYSQLACFTTDHQDAAVLAHELGPPVGPEDLVSLPRFAAIVRLTVGAERLPAFQVRTLDIARQFVGWHHPELEKAVKSASDLRAAPMTASEVDEALFGLDRVIVNKFSGRHAAIDTLVH